ncbi:hypothetical protein BAMA_12770 [Bacillus manliponensis]|uniref:Regulatory protein YycH-like domain-containing protein n=1 Tax=Bacillus manliponensis TaxID=574376 RepID=A0A073K5I4_9BACI|nr:two-component system regulatory protein YycI [Bacillus manliponensis]KEK17503.1 hypothetical protein BAMA_12770 [Bacillus manliponensis]
MDWNRIKTIFIISFLVLDLFLAFQFIQKKENNQLDYMTETKIEDQLKADKITYENLPKDPKKDTFITASSKKFTEEDVKTLKDQTVSLQEEKNKIVSKLKEPLGDEKTKPEDNYDMFLKSYVLEGQKYTFAKVDGTKVYFHQKFRDKSIFYNPNGMIVAELNDKKQIVSYTQTMLTDLQEMGGSNKEQEIITAQSAFETLFEKNELYHNTHIKEAKIGYATVVDPSSSNVQVLAPTWNLKSDKKEDYFVNAIEGQVIKLGVEKQSEIEELME